MSFCPDWVALVLLKLSFKRAAHCQPSLVSTCRCRTICDTPPNPYQPLPVPKAQSRPFVAHQKWKKKTKNKTKRKKSFIAVSCLLLWVSLGVSCAMLLQYSSRVSEIQMGITIENWGSQLRNRKLYTLCWIHWDCILYINIYIW